eukprot:TRINITY_DN972_c0_g1_i1.p2 TRINITY_DN972_c0_g1~~TRINITY_DN972_c0_g1_i1.p2  ORF type:complete len:201 (-),score=32.64 TRINITY_DN972_c0_g1_i1:147-749(-)
MVDSVTKMYEDKLTPPMHTPSAHRVRKNIQRACEKADDAIAAMAAAITAKPIARRPCFAEKWPTIMPPMNHPTKNREPAKGPRQVSSQGPYSVSTVSGPPPSSHVVSYLVWLVQKSARSGASPVHTVPSLHRTSHGSVVKKPLMVCIPQIPDAKDPHSSSMVPYLPHPMSSNASSIVIGIFLYVCSSPVVLRSFRWCTLP